LNGKAPALFAIDRSGTKSIGGELPYMRRFDPDQIRFHPSQTGISYSANRYPTLGDEFCAERIVWTLAIWRALLWYLLGIGEIVQLAVFVYLYGLLVGLLIVLVSSAALWFFGTRLGLYHRSGVYGRLST